MYVEINYDLIVGKICLLFVKMLKARNYIFKIFSSLTFIITFSALFDSNQKLNNGII
jgi:hypothetical protein